MPLGHMMTFKAAYQIAAGLAYLHRKSIIFCDLKSDNILVWSLEVGTRPRHASAARLQPCGSWLPRHQRMQASCCSRSRQGNCFVGAGGGQH